MADSPFTREIIKAISEGRNTVRGLPAPKADIDSLYNTVSGLKEAVETLLRSRNELGESAVLVKELDPIFKVIEFQINKAISNLEIEPGTGGVTSHGDLTGLEDDDHSQYGLRDDNDIQLDFKTALAKGYKEFTYNVDNKVQRIDIWEDATKTRKLFTKVLGYNPSLQVTSIVTTDEVSGKVLTKALTYLGVNIQTLTETVT